MVLSSVVYIVLQLFSLQMMVLSSPLCRLQGVLVESAHHLLRDLVQPQTFKLLCFYCII